MAHRMRHRRRAAGGRAVVGLFRALARPLARSGLDPSRRGAPSSRPRPDHHARRGIGGPRGHRLPPPDVLSSRLSAARIRAAIHRRVDRGDRQSHQRARARRRLRRMDVAGRTASHFARGAAALRAAAGPRLPRDHSARRHHGLRFLGAAPVLVSADGEAAAGRGRRGGRGDDRLPLGGGGADPGGRAVRTVRAARRRALRRHPHAHLRRDLAR